jgi:hypothetical protein
MCRPTQRALDWWESARFQTLARLEVDSVTIALACPAHQQVTQTVGLLPFYQKEIVMETLGLFLSAILMFLFDYFPILVVWLVGLVLAVINRNKYPQIARFTIIALAIFFIVSLVNTYVSRMLPIWLTQRGFTATEMIPVFTVRNLIVSVVSAFGWGFVLAAIFSGRKATVGAIDASIPQKATE